MSKKLRVGLIGLGVGEQHIDGFERDGACEVVSLCDFSEEKLREVSARYPGKRIHREASEVIADPAIDIISIASFDNFHHAQILAAIRAGKHLFVEKPLCLYDKEAREIRAELKKHPQLKISSNLILRASPRFRNLRARIQAGDLGDLFCVEGDYNYGRIHKLHSGWRGEIPYYSVILGGGLHLLDLILWLSGDEVAEVAAFGNSISSRGSQFKANDTALALLKFKSGMVGKVGANFACVYPHFHKLSVYGTKASFENGLQHATLFTSRDAKVDPERITDAYPGVHKGDLIPSFVDSILGKGRAIVDTDDIFRGLAACFAVEKALRDGGTVKVEAL